MTFACGHRCHSRDATTSFFDDPDGTAAAQSVAGGVYHAAPWRAAGSWASRRNRASPISRNTTP